MPNPTEPQILDLGLHALKRETGLDADVLTRMPDAAYDAIICVAGEKFHVEIKKWAQHVSTGALISQLKRLPQPAVLVADFVNPRMVDELRRNDVQFFDTAGNAYLRGTNLYVLVKGNRLADAHRTTNQPTGRAFTTTGLKVVFAFLCDPNLVDAPYRKIAHVADVAAGTVGWVLNDLKANAYVLQRRKPTRRVLTKKRQLLDRWVETYPEQLKPKLKIGNFEAGKADWWKEFDLTRFSAYWGGEIAGALLTKHLRPEVATIYVDAARWAGLAGAAHLRKLMETGRFRDTERNLGMRNAVRLYRTFWHAPTNDDMIVDPVLAYADLVATADQRNIETANLIFRKYIRGRLGES